MKTTLEQFQRLLESRSENKQLEFKEAKSNFSWDKLIQYCAAIANEKGGTLIFGVSDKKPRKVVGTSVYPNIEEVEESLLELLHIRVDLEEFIHPDGRVLIFHIPSRPIGTPIQLDGAYWMRSGEGLVRMTPEILKRIFEEASLDFSSEICKEAKFSDLDEKAIESFRDLWIRKLGNHDLRTKSLKQLLQDAELLYGEEITNAALILFGKRSILSRYLYQAEVIFEYRSDEHSIEFQQRQEFREGLFLFFEKLWNLLNTHNDIQHFQDGLFKWDIYTFNEKVIREAILNAICHRDYRKANSIFIKQFPKKIVFISPGGFPEGITPENILYHQFPRNRRIAEALARCGLVERSGQGFDIIYRTCIEESKSLPDFSGTNEYQVCLSLNGIIQDSNFLKFLEKVGKETKYHFSLEDLLVLNLIKQNKQIPPNLSNNLKNLIEKGILESSGRGRGTKYFPSKRFYEFSGESGKYTKTKGLDKETNKSLLLQHLAHYHKGQMKEFLEVLPQLNRDQIQSLLKELRMEKKIEFAGQRQSGYWKML